MAGIIGVIGGAGVAATVCCAGDSIAAVIPLLPKLIYAHILL